MPSLILGLSLSLSACCAFLACCVLLRFRSLLASFFCCVGSSFITIVSSSSAVSFPPISLHILGAGVPLLDPSPLSLSSSTNCVGFCDPFRNPRHRASTRDARPAEQHRFRYVRYTRDAPTNAHSVQGAKQREGEPLCLAQRHDSMQMNVRNLKM